MSTSVTVNKTTLTEIQGKDSNLLVEVVIKGSFVKYAKIIRFEPGTVNVASSQLSLPTWAELKSLHKITGDILQKINEIHGSVTE